MLFSLFPQPEDAQRIAQLAIELRSQHGLAAKPLAAARLHISLHALASLAAVLPPAVLNATRAAAARVSSPPLPIVFEQVFSFEQSNAFALRCDPGSANGVARLRQLLGRKLRRVGLHSQPSSTPHMTMLNDRQRVAEHRIERLRRNARRFVSERPRSIKLVGALAYK